MNRSVRVSVAGNDLSLRTDAKPKYVKELASYVNDKIQEAKGGGGHSASTQALALLAAMSIADELFQLRSEHKTLRAEVKKRGERILRALDREAEA